MGARVIDMNETRLRALEQLRTFLEGTGEVEFQPVGGDEGRYEHIQAVLKRPLWLCPMRLGGKNPSGFLKPGGDKGEHETYVDVAVVSVPGPVLRREEYNAMDAVRQMETF